MKNPALLIAAITAYAYDLAREEIIPMPERLLQLVSPDEADDVSAARSRPPS